MEERPVQKVELPVVAWWSAPASAILCWCRSEDALDLPDSDAPSEERCERKGMQGAE